MDHYCCGLWLCYVFLKENNLSSEIYISIDHLSHTVFYLSSDIIIDSGCIAYFFTDRLFTPSNKEFDSSCRI